MVRLGLADGVRASRALIGGRTRATGPATRRGRTWRWPTRCMACRDSGLALESGLWTGDDGRARVGTWELGVNLHTHTHVPAYSISELRALSLSLSQELGEPIWLSRLNKQNLVCTDLQNVPPKQTNTYLARSESFASSVLAVCSRSPVVGSTLAFGNSHRMNDASSS